MIAGTPQSVEFANKKKGGRAVKNREIAKYRTPYVVFSIVTHSSGNNNGNSAVRRVYEVWRILVFATFLYYIITGKHNIFKDLVSCCNTTYGVRCLIQTRSAPASCIFSKQQLSHRILIP